MKRALLITIPLVSLLLAAMAHKFYFSTTTLDYNAKTSSIEITIHTFTEDFEAAVEGLVYQRLFLGSDKELESADELIQTYLKNHLVIEIDGDRKTPEFVGKEVEIHDMWIYLEIKDLPAPSTVKVESSLLLEIFEEQINLVKVNVGERHEQFHLNKGKTTGSASFE